MRAQAVDDDVKIASAGPVRSDDPPDERTGRHDIIEPQVARRPDSNRTRLGQAGIAVQDEDARLIGYAADVQVEEPALAVSGAHLDGEGAAGGRQGAR